MDNDELNEALLALCEALCHEEIPRQCQIVMEMALEAVTNQIRYRAEGSCLASKVSA